MKVKIDDWKNKFLSFAGRVQLISSVLSSMQVFWSSIFMLLDSVIKDMEKIMRGFLWFQGEMKRAWYDSWTDFGPLAEVISPREIHQAALRVNSKVEDLLGQNGWSWPENWLSKFPMLAHIPFPNISRADKACWRDVNGNLVEFSAKAAWDSLRPRAQRVDWYNMVCIPRHSFIMWLLMGEILKTQDKMRVWDVGTHNQGPFVCSLCKLQKDTHDHLFFECNFSKKVWTKIKR
ncbi:uncharacterized protein [Rutidosis leptorrhynchoides]|uniref:uncharacterized protein n=1 Tax=Rutidosis leptorrhynchoides TaxID=125765 RepID=UPI003A993629